MGATAPALDMASRVATEAVLNTEPGQGSLFPPVREPMRVVRMQQPQASRRDVMQRAAAKPVGREDRQQSLPLHPSVNPQPGHASSRQYEPSIYCKASVALPAHRLMATAVDAAMILIGIGIFGGVSYAAGVFLAPSKTNLIFYGLGIFVLVTLYRLLWAAASTDSIGMRSCGLQLLNFDGAVPDSRQRIQRVFSSYLSLAAGGLGLLWALADEEKLTWHDHISKSFPTPILSPSHNRRSQY